MLASLLALSLGPAASAATISWTGAVSADWFTAGNWSPATVPGPLDDVRIEISSFVTADSPGIAFASFALGDPSGASAPVLRFTRAQSPAGTMTIHPGARLLFETNERASFGGLRINSGGLITHTANAGSRRFVVDIAVAGDLELLPGAEISADAVGYAGGSGPNTSGFGPGGGAMHGSLGDGAGGGHAGAGGASGAGGEGGPSNDETTNPVNLGSGGGLGSPNAAGGSGGGAVLIAVGGSFALNGRISANGGGGATSTSGLGSGGGAGGTVNIKAAVLIGSGTVSANGGAGGAGVAGRRGGGGGGGRVAIAVSGVDGSSLLLQATGGAAGGADAGRGGAGTLARRAPGAALFDLVIGDPGFSPQAPTGIAGSSPSFSGLTLHHSIVNFDAGGTVTINSLIIPGTVTLNAGALAFNGGTLELMSGSRLTMNARSSSGGRLVVHDGGVFEQGNNARLGFASISVRSGGALTHALNFNSRAALLNLAVDEDFELQARAAIAANARGYAGGSGLDTRGFGPGGGFMNGSIGDSGGGGHGGAGGSASTGAPGGPSNDSTTNPADLGSGGGLGSPNGPGGNGGGAVLISVGGEFLLNGLITADGADGTVSGSGEGAGGGAGGTVNIRASSLLGSGTLLANGGAGGAGVAGRRGGGGGGGRIAITVTGSDSSNLNLQANGGAPGGADAGRGGAGVIALKTSGGLDYNLAIGDLSVSPQAPTGVAGSTPSFVDVTLNNSIVNFDAGSTVTLNRLLVAGVVDLRAGTISLPGGSIEVLNGGVLRLDAQRTAGGELKVNGGGMFRQMNAASLGLTSVKVLPGGVLTHASNFSSRAALLNLDVSGDFDLQAGATIALIGLGYAGGSGPNTRGFGPGGGFMNGSIGDGGGGGHGGAGGNGSTGAGASGGPSNDSASNPMDLGSGGGLGSPNGPGGSGGGAALLRIGGQFRLDGRVDVDGGQGNVSGSGQGAGGGAGGAVNIVASSFTGSGFISARGGGGGPGFSQPGGGGGGGIVALTGCDSATVANDVSGGAAGGGAAGPGGTGAFSAFVPPGCPAPPPAPTHLALSASGEDATGSIFFVASWSGAAPSFTLEASTRPNFVPIAASSTTTGNGATLRRLASNTTYYLRVFASNSFGSSPPTPPLLALTVMDLSAPAPPTLLSAVARLGTTVDLEWTPASTGENADAFNVYRETYSFSSSAGLQPAYLQLATSSLTELPPGGGPFYYAVTALDYTGNESAPSNVLVAIPAIVDDPRSLIVPEGYEYSVAGARSYADSIEIGGTLRVSALSQGGVGWVELAAPQVSISSTGRISADGAGLPSATGPGAGYNSLASSPFDSHGGGGGAGYGGWGGVGDSFHALSGAVYGNLVAPGELGSGGGAGGLADGGAGGGRIRIDADVLSIEGRISASGGDSVPPPSALTFKVSGGGGSGGSIMLSAGALSGGGVIAADGGNSTPQQRTGGGGGGGRIALPLGGGSFNGRLSATGGSGVRAGGAGTVVIGPELRVANSVTGASTTIPSGSWSFETMTISSFALVELAAGAVVDAGRVLMEGGGRMRHHQGSLLSSRLELLPAAALRFDGGRLAVDELSIASGAVLELNTRLRTARLTVLPGGLVTHSPRAAGFELEVADVLRVDAGGRISADARGFPGDIGPGRGLPGAGSLNGSLGGGGAGYGGAGAAGSGGPAGGGIYGSIFDPRELGSGGGFAGGPGGAGGGRLRVEAGSLALNGRISADGGDGAQQPPNIIVSLSGGGGSGGAISISADSISGSGQVSARGGSTVSPGAVGGGGGGGRIALYYGSRSGSWSAAAPGGAGAGVGRPGTVLENGALSGLDPGASTGTVAAAPMAATLESSQSLSETLSSQLLDFADALSTGTAPGSFRAAELELVRVKTGPYAGRGFFRGRWTLELSAQTVLDGAWEGVAFPDAGAPERLILKGQINGQIRGALDGVLLESAPGSGQWTQLSLDARVVHVDAVQGSGDMFIGAVPSPRASAEHPGTSLALLQTSLSGVTSGYYNEPLDATFTLLRVDQPGHPYQGEGLFFASYNSALGPGQGWARARAVGSTARLAGALESPLRGLMDGVLVANSPRSLIMTLANLDAGAAFAPDLSIDYTGPNAVDPGTVATFAVIVRNDGYIASAPQSVVAVYPENTDFVSASGQYLRYNVAHWPNGVDFIAKPFVRWDIPAIPARSVMNFNYQAFIRLPGAGAPPAGSALGGDVRLLPTANTDEFFAGYPPGGTSR